MSSKQQGTVSHLGECFGRWIDTNSTINFSFNGKKYQGFQGDVIASALARRGQWLLSRSFKYHRPRGILSMAGNEANTIVGMDNEPHVYADLRAIEKDMVVHSINSIGSLDNDALSILDKFGRFLPVGFYYKSFFKPRGAWKFWEPIIRRIAGLGTINKNTPHKYYDKAYGFYDLVVIGGGAAGMSAALAGVKENKSVLLIEESAHLGGALNWERLDVEGTKAYKQRQKLCNSIKREDTIEVMTDSIATGLFTDGWISVTYSNRMYKIRAQTVIVATGLVELPAIFRNNDRPGVMLASAAQKLMRLYSVSPGNLGVVITANEAGYGAVLDCLEAGIAIATIIDIRKKAPTDSPLHDAVCARGQKVMYNSAVVEVQGNKKVTAVVVADIEEGSNSTPSFADNKQIINCDFVLTSVGWSPNNSLLSHGGVTFSYNHELAMHCPSKSNDSKVFYTGSVAGLFDLSAILRDGSKVGKDVANDASFVQKQKQIPISKAMNHPYPIFSHQKGKDFVDFDEDLQVKDIINSQKHGFRDIQLTKRYSTLGMGPSQGRHSNINAIRIIARYSNQKEDEVGTTTARPPYRSEKFAHLAGRSFNPVRLTSMHQRHKELGATFMPAGDWLRPAYYGTGEAKKHIDEEVHACRSKLAIIDVSTLGGIDIRGTDAAEFVNRMYTWAYLKQQVQRARYLLMTDESGVVIDDGVACRLHENHYYLTATTSGVDGVYREMLRWNSQWRLDVDISNVTAGYSGVNLAGPLSRKVLQPICNVDLSAESFPYMGAFTGEVAGIPARLLRVGFVGELGFEIHVPASQGEALWDVLMAEGRKHDIRPFGVEAQRIMRLEKGHIIIGQDTDGLTTPYEADMEWALGKKKPYYVGKKSVDIQGNKKAIRKLIGFKLKDNDSLCPKECHLVINNGNITGRVTSAVLSPTLNEVIGLAYVGLDQADYGTTFQIKVDNGVLVEAVVAKHPFYDPEGKRQEM